MDVAYEGTSEVSRAIFGQTGAMQKWLTVIDDLLKKYEVTEYNPEKAYAIFEGLGFKRGADGVWVTPNGTRLALTVLTPPWIEVMGYTMVFVEDLKAGGIDAVVKVMESTPWSTKLLMGDFEATASWLCPMGTHEPYTYLESYGHSRYFKPVGEMCAGMHYNSGRFKNSTYDYWVDEMGKYSETDPKYIEAFRKAYEIWLQEMPGIPLTLSRKLLSFDNYYWVGWPTVTDPYIAPFFWCGYGLRVSLQMKVRPKTVEYQLVYFTKDTPAFRGIDLVWYGPFKAGDATRVPVDDAEWNIRRGYASYTAPAPAISPEMTEALGRLNATIVTRTGALLTEVRGLSSQVATMSTAAAVEGVAIIVLAVALIVLRRKPT